MKKSILQSYKIGMLIVSIVVGAGFASGRELVTFFGKFGYAIIPISILCGVFLFGALALFMKVGKILQPNGLEDFNRAIFGKFAPVIDFLMLFNYLIILSTMLAGTDSLLKINFLNGIPILSVITAVLTFIVVYKGFDALLNVNSVLIPIILFMALIISIFSLTHPIDYHFEFESNIALLIFFIVIYVSMNIMLSCCIITTIKQPLKEQLRGAATGSIVIAVFIAILTAAILSAGISVYNSEMPVMEIASRMNMSFTAGIIIWGGIFTTILSTAYTLNNWVGSFIKSRKISLISILFVSLIISRIGFKTIVDSFYPVSGIIGLFYITAVFIYYLKRKKNFKMLS